MPKIAQSYGISQTTDFAALALGGLGLHTFTLDTNCIIAVEKNEPVAGAIRKLIDHLADVAVVAMSASEKPKGRRSIRNFSEFQDRLAGLGWDHVNIILPMKYWDITFWDHDLWIDDGAMTDLERQIHTILFPTTQFLWQDYCRAKGISSTQTPFGTRWGNHKCDVQAIWSHINAGRSVFVTTDNNFLKTKKPALIALGAGRIEHPEEAIHLL
jgi:hypothetical protein